ncbi:MAG: MarC family protein [Bacteroidota bacterium]|jgi:multiple antibiotic resistance protein|nr:NAAT family transporter [Bacteroidota bacterium]MCA6441804.1 NAAT family transporter [Bacteroidota bacterium]
MSLLALISSLVSVLNPIGAVPMFISFTSNRTPEEIKKISIKCTFYVFLILIVAFVSGNVIIDFFGISIHSMKVAGGIIMLLSGVSFINNKRDTHKGINQKVKIEAIEKEDISFTPLAMPLLAGPGSMSYLVSLNFADKNLTQILIVFLAIFIVCSIILLILLSSRYFAKLIGTSGLMALSRLMGFFVMCIGVELIYTGVKHFIMQP